MKTLDAQYLECIEAVGFYLFDRDSLLLRQVYLARAMAIQTQIIHQGRK